MAKLAIFFGSGYEEIEALTVVDLVRRAKLDIDMISISDDNKVTGSHGIEVTMDKVISDISFDDYDMLILPGGMPGTKNLEACELLMQNLDAFNESGKLIAAICAAPSIFGHRGYLKNKRACCYPSFESHLEGAFISQEKAVVDGNIITGRGMGAAIEFGLAIVSKFCGKEAADALADAIVY